MRNDRARHTILVLNYGAPDFRSWDYFSIVFLGLGNLLAGMLFIIVYYTHNGRIIRSYRRILSRMAADI